MGGSLWLEFAGFYMCILEGNVIKLENRNESEVELISDMPLYLIYEIS